MRVKKDLLYLEKIIVEVRQIDANCIAGVQVANLHIWKSFDGFYETANSINLSTKTNSLTNQEKFDDKHTTDGYRGVVVVFYIDLDLVSMYFR